MEPRRAKRILIVDDNLGLAENVAEILQFDGYETAVAASAEEAIAKIDTPEGPDTLITDYRLPGASGAELIRQLSGMGIRIHAIVISAYTDTTTVSEAEKVGATFVAKPIDFALLGRTIRGRTGSA